MRRLASIAVVGVVLVVTAGAAAGGTPAGRGPDLDHLRATRSTAPSCQARPGKYSRAQVQAAYRAVTPLFETAGQDIGTDGDTVQLGLGTGQEELASLIEDHFGTLVQLSVAGIAYCHGPGPNAACPVLRAGDRWPKGLRLALVLDSQDINPTQSVSGRLTVAWKGPGIFRMSIGQPLVADTVQPGTRHVAGTFSGAIAGTGEQVQVSNGQSMKIAVLVGTSRCGGGRGSALSARRYDVRVLLAPETPGNHRAYLSPGVRLTVNGPLP